MSKPSESGARSNVQASIIFTGVGARSRDFLPDTAEVTNNPLYTAPNKCCRGLRAKIANGACFLVTVFRSVFSNPVTNPPIKYLKAYALGGPQGRAIERASEHHLHRSRRAF
jgi:hypothetical protein